MGEKIENKNIETEHKDIKIESVENKIRLPDTKVIEEMKNIKIK